MSKYKYLIIRKGNDDLPLEWAEEISKEAEFEFFDDDVALFAKLYRIKDLKQMEFLVLKMFGYEYHEMPAILNVKSIDSIYQISNKLMAAFSKEMKDFSV